MLWLFVKIASPRLFQQNVFLGVNCHKASLLLYFIPLHVGISFNSKCFLTAKSQGTKPVVITRVLCTYLILILSLLGNSVSYFTFTDVVNKSWLWFDD